MTAAGLNIGLVAGEASGDRLAASLMAALSGLKPATSFSGMAGPKMRALGCEAVADIDQLSVMGLTEVLRSYVRLHRLREQLIEHFLRNRPDVVVGIDVPDFNLGLERRLKLAGIPTVHYVCPQAWAWRAGRAKRLAQSCDKLLALLPFEPAFFKASGIDTRFVGHPLADQLPLQPDRTAARQRLKLAGEGEVLALLPGSRQQELNRHLGVFCAAAKIMCANRPRLQVVLAVARETHRDMARAALRELPGDVRVACSQDVLSAADVAIVASGTATLEAFLCATPLVVGYRLAPLSYHIIKRMVTIPRIALPNILTERDLVPELIQHEMTPTTLAAAAEAWLVDESRRLAYQALSRDWHANLRCDAGARAAQAVLELCGTDQ